MKYGLEKEFFVANKDYKIQIIKDHLLNLPYDQCGCLLEARGKPFDSIREAVYSLIAEEVRIKKEVNKLGLLCLETDIEIVTRDFKRDLYRIHNKGLLSFENMYDYKDNRHNQNEMTAAIHISFTNEVSIETKTGFITVNKFFDFIKYVKALDKAFKEEIKNAKRNPGFYEVKYDGRVEYRSLPSSASYEKIITVIESVK